MRIRFWVLLFLLVCHGSVHSGSHVYSLPFRSSVEFISDGKAEQFDRVEIVASEDLKGRPASPFEIIGYDGASKVMRRYVVGAKYAPVGDIDRTISSDGHAARRDVVGEGFVVGDQHYRISAEKADGMFRVKVDNLDSQRWRGEAMKEMARLFKDGQATNTLARKWPSMDEGLRYTSSSEEFSLVRGQKGEEGKVLGMLRLKGALYQKGNEFSVRFGCCCQGMDGCARSVAEGRVTGEIVDGNITNRVVTYEFGENEVGLQVSVRKDVECMTPQYEQVGKVLENAGIIERTIRLNLTSGSTDVMIDLKMYMNR